MEIPVPCEYICCWCVVLEPGLCLQVEITECTRAQVFRDNDEPRCRLVDIDDVVQIQSVGQ